MFCPSSWLSLITSWVDANVCWDAMSSHYLRIWPSQYSDIFYFPLTTHLGCRRGAGGKNHWPEAQMEFTWCHGCMQHCPPQERACCLGSWWPSRDAVACSILPAERLLLILSSVQIAPQILWPFLCKLGELWPQQVVPQAGESATGLEADGPPDATLTHRLALIADADH